MRHGSQHIVVRNRRFGQSNVYENIETTKWAESKIRIKIEFRKKKEINSKGKRKRKRYRV